MLNISKKLIHIDAMPDKARKKLFYNISLVSMGVVDSRIFKKLGESRIWEFRAEYESNEYRLLSFWDKTRSSIVVATHGFDKKTRKTPKQEIEHTESIRDNYYKTREENGD